MELKKAIKTCKEIMTEAKKEVMVSCDDYHGHSALRGCIGGEPNSVNICKMGETIKLLEKKLLRIKALLDDIETDETK